MSESPDQRTAELEQQVAALQAENAGLRERTDERLRSRVAQLAALQKVNNAANSTLHLEATLQLIVEAVADVMAADVCSIYLFESNALVLRATHGLNAAAVGSVRIRLGEGVTGWAALEGQPVSVPDAWNDPRFRYVEGLGEDPYRSMLAVPIILFTYGKLIGVVSIQTIQRTEFSPDEIAFLETVAGQVAIAIENARLYEQTDQQLRQTVEQLTMLQQISSAVVSSLDPRTVLDLVVRQAVRLSGARQAALFRLEKQTEILRISAAVGLGEETIRRWSVHLHEGGIGAAVHAPGPTVFGNVMSFPENDQIRIWAEVEGFRSLYCMPLVTRRHTSGVLVIFADEPDTFSQEGHATLTAFAGHAAIALENAHNYGEAQRHLAIKSAMLSEMHHRVKNNLQTVAALLSLQARRTSETAAQALWDSVSRVQSIAAVHDLLSREQFGTARVGDLVRQIMESVITSQSFTGTRLNIVQDGDEVWLGSKESTTLALILTELLVNAAKHAFPGRQTGTVHVHNTLRDGRAEITIRDDGCGLPEEFDLDRNRGLGLQIVQTLVGTDLLGSFSLTSDSGTVARISFPINPESLLLAAVPASAAG